MTLVSIIIQNAFRESNILPAGATPTANQSAEALHLYNGLISSLYGGDVGERIADWPLGNFDRSDQWAPPIAPYHINRPRLNSRLIASNEVAATVYFPGTPQDGARMAIVDPYSRLADAPVTIDANGRTIDGAPTLTLATSGFSGEWFYRAEKAGWLKLSDLLATDENPFPKHFDMMFEILLCLRINPRYGRTIDPQSAAMLKTSQRDFISRYLQSAPLDADDSLSWPFMSNQGYNSGRSFSSSTAFNRGSIDGRE